jgi:hypothetical protein
MSEGIYKDISLRLAIQADLISANKSRKDK